MPLKMQMHRLLANGYYIPNTLSLLLLLLLCLHLPILYCAHATEITFSSLILQNSIIVTRESSYTAGT